MLPGIWGNESNHKESRTCPDVCRVATPHITELSLIIACIAI